MTHGLIRDDKPPIAVPSHINNLPVIAAIPVPSDSGSQCHLWVVVVHDATREPGWDCITWRIACGGPTRCGEFNAWSGMYELSWQQAIADMAMRANLLTLIDRNGWPKR